MWEYSSPCLADDSPVFIRRWLHCSQSGAVQHKLSTADNSNQYKQTCSWAKKLQTGVHVLIMVQIVWQMWESFYLLFYSIALRTFLLSSLEMSHENGMIMTNSCLCISTTMNTVTMYTIKQQEKYESARKRITQNTSPQVLPGSDDVYKQKGAWR